MDILLTNDDGIQAVGLRALYKAFTGAGHRVRVAAPVTEQSAVGHAVTLALPLRVKEFREDGFTGQGVYGTPVDCVKLALTALADTLPDVVVSGINAGANVGVDIIYSGTVAAATEAALMGRPAVAVSYDDFNPTDLSAQAERTVALVESMDFGRIPPKTLLNLNFPSCPMDEAKELVVCRHTRAMYKDSYETRHDPRGRPYYWLDGAIPPELLSPDTDRSLLTRGHVTLTPLRFDFTDRETMETLAGMLHG